MPVKKKKTSKTPPTRARKPAPSVRTFQLIGPRTAPARTPPPFSKLFQEERSMRAQVDQDRAQRYRSYLEQVQAPMEAPGRGIALRAAAPVAAKRPLRILAEGDSWFDYPLPWPDGDGVITQLQDLLGYSIANMAHYGLEVQQMMGLSIRQEIIKRLKDSQVKWDALLFSGGGNDLVGDRLCIWLKETPPVPTPSNMLNPAAVSAALSMLEAEFRELVALRDQYSPQTVIFVHGYDFPPVTGKRVCGKGPWLKPSLDYAYQQMGVAHPDPNDEFVVVKTLLQQFNAMLAHVQSDPMVKEFQVVPTQGALTPDNSDWQNEIHPSTTGFVKIAKRFQASLAAVFP